MWLYLLDWVGSGPVLEGSRQLEMGAHVECKELRCVVGGPFKPNKLREVQGLVWRPWINKPLEMTMHCADICHYTTPESKHKRLFFPLFVPCPKCSLDPPWLLHPSPFFLAPSALVLFHLFSCSSSIPLHHHHLHSFSSSLPSGSIHPSVHPCMHGWPSIRGSVCYTTALVLSRLLNMHTVQAEEGFIYQTELRTLPHIVVAGKTWKKWHKRFKCVYCVILL